MVIPLNLTLTLNQTCHSTSSQVFGSKPTADAKTNGDSIKFLSQEELKSKNKDGLSYALLFQHGKKG
jgi:hypothetical protein